MELLRRAGGRCQPRNDFEPSLSIESAVHCEHLFTVVTPKNEKKEKDKN
jgi:hypothetical protein